jgi:hypothetical protein
MVWAESTIELVSDESIAVILALLTRSANSSAVQNQLPFSQLSIENQTSLGLDPMILYLFRVANRVKL